MESWQNVFTTENDSRDSAKAASHSSVQNPIVGALVYGLAGIVCVTLGAFIRENNVHDEGVAVLLGGLISGAISGAVGMFIAFRSPHIMVRLEPFLQSSAFFLAPAIGSFVLGHHHIPFTTLLIDSLVGGSILFGFVFIVVASVLPCSISSSDNH
jgi:hypothetical protein